jgi:hypothetical protein
MRAKHPHWDKMAEFSYPVKSFPKHPHNIEGMVILRHFRVLNKITACISFNTKALSFDNMEFQTVEEITTGHYTQNSGLIGHHLQMQYSQEDVTKNEKNMQE